MKATNNIEKKLKEYLQTNLLIDDVTNLDTEISINEETLYSTPSSKIAFDGALKTSNNTINNYINKELDNNNFQTKLFTLIDASGKTDAEIYNKAYIDRRLFSKIRNDTNYHPSKNTVISLGLALNLNITDFEGLLNSASYSLPKNNYFDLIIRFCINEKIYNITEVNNYLYQYNCNTIN